jgi:hypothetical protein
MTTTAHETPFHDSHPLHKLEQIPLGHYWMENHLYPLVGATHLMHSINLLMGNGSLMSKEEKKMILSMFSLSLSTNAKELEQGQTYSLGSEFTVGGVSGKYLFNGNVFDTDDENSGELTITRLDLNAQIISGTFFYDVIDGIGNLREIRDGRFDMRFTQ